MIKLDKFQILLKAIQSYISDSRKNYISRSDVTKCIVDCEQCEFGALLGLHFNFVSKTFLLYNRHDSDDHEPKRIFIKTHKELDEYRLISSCYTHENLKSIKTAIFNLTDTKYVMVINNPTYDSLLSTLASHCVYNFYWFKSADNTLYTRAHSMNHIKYEPNRLLLDNKVQENFPDKAKRFEETLVNSVSFITQDKSMTNTDNEYNFSIFKINDVVLAVLFPKCDPLVNRGTLINIWPIIPVSCVQNCIKFIRGLKVSNEAKMRFRKFYSDKSFLNCTYKITNLRSEIIKGITFPQMLRNKLNLNQIYIAYFLEFLVEHVHYEFASLIDNCASYIQCCHCGTIFDNIFGFIRHWWEYRDKCIFRCHLCDRDYRTQNLNQLGNHFLDVHIEMKDEFTLTPSEMMDDLRSILHSADLTPTNVSHGPTQMQRTSSQLIYRFNSIINSNKWSNPNLSAPKHSIYHRQQLDSPIKRWKSRSPSNCHRRSSISNVNRRHFLNSTDSNNDNNELSKICQVLPNVMIEYEHNHLRFRIPSRSGKRSKSATSQFTLNWAFSNNSNRSRQIKIYNTFLKESNYANTSKIRNAAIHEYHKAIKPPEFKKRTLKTPEIEEYMSRRLFDF